MPLLQAEADKRTQTDLNVIVVEHLIERGAPDVLAQLPFKPTEGSAYGFVIEKNLSDEPSAQDPYGMTVFGSPGENEQITVPPKMLMRHVDTAEIDIIMKSNMADQRADDILKGSKALARDFLHQMVYGMGTGINMRGFEYWLDFYETFGYTEQRYFATSSGLPDANVANREVLSLAHLDDLLSRYKGEGFQVIYSDRKTRNEFKAILNTMPGNTAEMVMNPLFGKPMLHYDGVPWVVLDPVGGRKVSKVTTGNANGGGAITATDTTLTVDDPYFVGFSKTDVGRSITIAGAGAAGATLSTTIASVTNSTTVEVADAAGTTVANATVTVLEDNRIYVVRFDESDGFSAIYANAGGQGANAGQYYAPIAGFNYKEIGDLESGPRVRGRLSFYGNFVQHKADSLGCLAHYKF